MIHGIKHHTKNAFPAFRYKNYRIFFAAQIISLVGTWMQMVSQGYLAYQLTHSAFWVGAVAAAAGIPSTILTLVGGTLVDRFPKKNILRITQTLQFILATSLGIFVLTGHISIPSLMIFVFLMGVVNSVDQPARMSIVVDLVDRDHLHAAFAMNQSMFNSARIVGPALAGWLIFYFGVGWAFLLNGLSFIGPIIAYSFINFAPFIKKPNFGTLNALKEGLNYAAHHASIRFLLLYMGFIGFFGWSYTSMLPVIADKVFHLDAQGLGMLFSAAGAGTVIGAITMSAYSRRLNPSKLILFGGLLFSISLFLFTLHSIFYLALFLLFISGFGMAYQNSTIQATIQKSVDSAVRGRVSSMQALMTQGMNPIGSFEIGIVAEHLGPQFAVRIGSVAIFIAAILLYRVRPKTADE
jgi:MFS family permease